MEWPLEKQGIVGPIVNYFFNNYIYLHGWISLEIFKFALYTRD